MIDIPNQKLLQAKQRWAEQGRLLTGTTSTPETARLPPGQRLVQDWPILDLGTQPAIDPSTYRLDITGSVRHPITLSFAAFMALPMIETTSDIHCVTQWSRYDNHWQGVAPQTLLDLVTPSDKTRHVILHAADGYTTNLRLDQFTAPGSLLAHAWEGTPLTREHGAPIRAIIPQLYLWKSAKWLRRIEFSITDRPGFWEENGYHNNADPWLEERYS